MFHLSYGALEKIHQGVDISDPLLQVLGHKAIPGGGPNRVRLHLSDGLFSTSTTVLAPQLNHLFNDHRLDQFAIVQVTKLVCNKVPAQPNKLVILLLEMVVITPGAQVGGKIGNPMELEFANKISPVPGAPCPHCHRHNHPPQLGSSGPTRPRADSISAEYRRALRAFLADFGPTLGLGGMGQAVPDLTGGSDDSGSDGHQNL